MIFVKGVFLRLANANIKYPGVGGAVCEQFWRE